MSGVRLDLTGLKGTVYYVYLRMKYVCAFFHLPREQTKQADMTGMTILCIFKHPLVIVIVWWTTQCPLVRWGALQSPEPHLTPPPPTSAIALRHRFRPRSWHLISGNGRYGTPAKIAAEKRGACGAFRQLL